MCCRVIEAFIALAKSFSLIEVWNDKNKSFLSSTLAVGRLIASTLTIEEVEDNELFDLFCRRWGESIEQYLS
jgi:hypothetical protein